MSRASDAAREWSFLRIAEMIAAALVGAAVARAASPWEVAAVAGAAVAYALFAAASVKNPGVFVAVLLVVLEAVPPLYFPKTGEAPIFISFLLLPIAVALLVCRLPDLRLEWDSLGRGLAAFLGATALSIPFAWWLSGREVGIESLTRWLLLSQVAVVYFLIRAARRQVSAGPRLFRLLLIAAVFSAAYGIVDFVWPVPLAHPAADQFIWLDSAVLRRAQGVFYESSNFANFCEIFLIAAAIGFLARREKYFGIPRYLVIVFISVLALAVLVAFSRTVWASSVVALLTCLGVSRFVRIRRGTLVLAASVIPLYLLWTFSPELWDYLVQSRVGRLADIFSDPNVATSGRFETWTHVLALIRENPKYLFFGIGYKTLPVTRLFHGEIVTDNGYLSLLLETGIVGLTGFGIWTWSILKTFFRLSRSQDDATAFWSAILFSMWCGELTLLLASDAHTYWRNLAVLAGMMALTLNLHEHSEAGRGGA